MNEPIIHLNDRQLQHWWPGSLVTGFSASFGFSSGPTDRAMFKLSAKNLFSLCLLVKNKSALYSADRCSFFESENDSSRNGKNLYKSWVERALNSGPTCHFRFANHTFNWQILIKVWTSVIGLSCLIRTILEYEKVRQIWTLLLGCQLNKAKRFAK